MDKVITEELIEQAISNPANQTPADLTDKTVVYFDQKAWGEIRDTKISSNSDHTSLDELAKRSVDEADFVYPFSLENIIETSSASDVEFKADVYDMMMDLSGNHSIRNYPYVFDHEARSYICERHNLLPELDSKSYVFGKGTAHAAGEWKIESEEGVPEEVMDEFIKVIRDEEVNRRLLHARLTEDTPEVTQEHRREYEDRYREKVQEIGEELELEDLEERSLYLSDVFLDTVMPRVRGYCRDLGLNPLWPILYDPRQLSFEAFFRRFPAFYTYSTLHFAVDAHTDREPEFNDVLDISQLAVAAPYADIVVTEQFFAGMLHRFDVGDAFDTDIYQDVDAFSQFLEETLD